MSMTPLSAPMRSCSPISPLVSDRRLGAADPVIADLDRAPAVVSRHHHRGGAGAGVLDHVGERLGAEEVDARLDRRRKPVAGQFELDRDGKPVGQGARGQRSGRAGSRSPDGSPRRSRAGRSSPCVASLEGEVEQLPGALRIRCPFLAGRAGGR